MSSVLVHPSALNTQNSILSVAPPTSTDPVTPSSCSTAFPILTDVLPDLQSPLAIEAWSCSYSCGCGSYCSHPALNSAPGLTNLHVGEYGDPRFNVAQWQWASSGSSLMTFRAQDRTAVCCRPIRPGRGRTIIRCLTMTVQCGVCVSPEKQAYPSFPFWSSNTGVPCPVSLSPHFSIFLYLLYLLFLFPSRPNIPCSASPTTGLSLSYCSGLSITRQSAPGLDI